MHIVLHAVFSRIKWQNIKFKWQNIKMHIAVFSRIKWQNIKFNLVQA